MTWDPRYRRLEEGELIEEGDQVLTDSRLGWLPAGATVGSPAPDPAYSSHRIYRRFMTDEERRDGGPKSITDANGSRGWTIR